MCENGANRDIMWKVDFHFNLPFALNINIDLGLDMGKGLGIFLNQELLLEDKNDLWWARTWGSSDVVSIEKTFPQGYNSLIVYGLEGCCDGYQSLRVQLGD